jgi:meckelin
VGVLSALAVIWSGVETWSSSRRCGRVGIDHVTLGKLIVFACGNLANVFLFVVACASLHTFTFYKGQSVVHVLLPSHREEQLLRGYTISALFLKVSHVQH